MRTLIGVSIAIVLIVSTLSVMLVGTAVGSQEDQVPWPVLGGNPQHDGTSDFNTSENLGGICGEFRIKMPVNDWSTAQPIVLGDGSCLIPGENGRLVSIDASGKKVWECFFESSSLSAPCIGMGGTILVGTWIAGGISSEVHALSPTGDRIWDTTVTGQGLSIPVISPNGTIYISSPDGFVHALSTQGEIVWSVHLNEGLSKYPMALDLDGTIIVPGEHLTAISPNGSILWRTDFHLIGSIPSIGPDGTIYAWAYGDDGENDGLCALGSNGDILWRAGIGRGTGAAIGADRIFVMVNNDNMTTAQEGSVENGLYAIHLNGTLDWSIPLNGNASGIPSLGSDGTIFLIDDGGVWAFTSDGVRIWHIEFIDDFWNNIAMGSPSIGANGTVYLFASDFRGEAIVYLINGERPNDSETYIFLLMGLSLVVVVVFICRNLRSRCKK